MTDPNQDIERLRAEIAGMRTFSAIAAIQASVGLNLAMALALTHPDKPQALAAFNAYCDQTANALHFSKATDADLEMLQQLREEAASKLQA